MSSGDSSPDTRPCGHEVAAYALRALDAHDIAPFEAHLRTCVVCREELIEFQHAADFLARTAPPYPAPRRLRRRVLGAVASEAHGLQRATRPGRPRATLRGALVGAAVVVAILVAVGVFDLRPAKTPHARTYPAQVIGGGSAELTVAGAHAELTVHHLPPPPPGQIYQVWLRRRGRPPMPTSALFSVTAAGDGDVDVPGNLGGVDAITVTPEPAGGSRFPTHATIIYARFG